MSSSYETPLPSDIAANESSPPLRAERVSFTGTLASMTHQKAHELVKAHGGEPMQHVSRRTTMLVIGEEGWPLEENGQPSQKLLQARRLREQGIDVCLLSESDWLHLIGLEERQQDARRLYTPAMLSQMLAVPVGTIRAWARAKLIRPVRTLYRLPYFDFQEVAGARRLKQLLEAGVTERELRAGLESLRTMFDGADRSLAQLDVLARDRRMLYRDEAGLIEPATGQRVFDFWKDEVSAPVDSGQCASLTTDHCLLSTGALSTGALSTGALTTAAEWFEEGCRSLDAGELAAAIESLRMSLMQRPDDPVTQFRLAEALYRQGRTDAALERYYAAVELDHDYLEAWTQLGCLHAELGQLESARDAFRIALDVHGDYPDAHWHLADVLSRMGQADKAVAHWREYLRFDGRGPWADSARQRLAELRGEIRDER